MTNKSNTLKTVAFVIAAAIVGVIIGYLFGYSSSHPIASSAVTTCYPDYSGEEYKPLSGSFATKLISNYRDNQWAFINNGINTNPSGVADYTSLTSSTPFADSRSVWFELKKLKRFIYEIESKSCNLSATPNLGLRFYYGQYPCDASQLGHDEFKDVNTAFAGLHTVVMIPTYDDASNNHIDFDPNHVSGGTPQPFECSWADITAMAPNLTMMNHGTLIPPPYNHEDVKNAGGGLMYCVDENNPAQTQMHTEPSDNHSQHHTNSVKKSN